MRSVIFVCEICDFLSEVCELFVKFCINELSFQILLSMAPPKRVSRSKAKCLKKKGDTLPPGKNVRVSLARVEVDSDDESRSPPRPEVDHNSGTGVGSTPGDGARPGDGQETGTDQSTAQGTSSARQSSNAE